MKEVKLVWVGQYERHMEAVMGKKLPYLDRRKVMTGYAWQRVEE